MTLAFTGSRRYSEAWPGRFADTSRWWTARVWLRPCGSAPRLEPMARCLQPTMNREEYSLAPSSEAEKPSRDGLIRTLEMTEKVVSQASGSATVRRFFTSWLAMAVVIGVSSVLGSEELVLSASSLLIIVTGSGLIAGTGLLFDWWGFRRYLRSTDAEVHARVRRDLEFFTGSGWRLRVPAVGVGVGILLGAGLAAIAAVVEPRFLAFGGFLGTASVMSAAFAACWIPFMLVMRKQFLQSLPADRDTDLIRDSLADAELDARGSSAP